jgi:hypothetical protein
MASTGLIEVAPGIFVEGTPDDGCQDALLKRAGITHLVEAAGATAALEDNGAASSVERLAFPILGLRGESFVEAFKESTAFINRAVDSGGRVLVQGTIEEWEERAQQQWRRRELRGLEGRTIAVVAASRAARGQALGEALEEASRPARESLGPAWKDAPGRALRVHLLRGLAAFAERAGAAPLGEDALLVLIEKYCCPATPPAALAALPWRTGVAGPKAEGACTRVTFKDGHAATVQTVRASPRVCVVPDFMTGDEARDVVALALGGARLKQSLVATTRQALADGRALTPALIESEGRTSRSCPVDRNVPVVAAAVRRRPRPSPAPPHQHPRESWSCARSFSS